ncbi:MAG TPA: hypothetical protein VMT32_08770 [Bryobacteraceae bacterium]|nr:hypothetical protein [Bryobacteraceae bacterium]
MRRWLYWCLVVPLYWAIVVYILREASPVYIDGGGPMPSFYWGRHRHSPGLGEHQKKRAPYDRLFSIPYYAAGLIVTVVGCGIGPWVVKYSARLRWRIFAISSAATLIMLLTCAVISDAGGLLGWWMGPMFLLMRSFSGPDIFVLAKIFLAASVLSGAVALGWSFVAPRESTEN